jgi:hypothetical protein
LLGLDAVLSRRSHPNPHSPDVPYGQSVR